MPAGKWTVHVIPQFHLDLSWTWQWRESLAMVESSMAGNAAALIAGSQATFAMSQVMLLDHTRRHYPEVFDDILELHRQGRWENVGGTWVESDLNIPSGEALARQFLYGQSFLAEQFGQIATTAWAPDCFGHSGNLPQIYKLAGIEHYILKRPRDINYVLPNVPFDWQGIDGTRILCLRVVNKGNGTPSAPSQGSAFSGEPIEHIKQIFADLGLQDLWGPMGVGDVGGVNTYKLPADTEGMQFQFSTPRRFFEAIKREEGPGRPVVTGELNPFMDGAYTTQVEGKRGNRQTENRLVHTEVMAALAARQGLPYPHDKIAGLWKRFLFTQFHDILPGTGEKTTHDQACRDFEQVAVRSEEIDRASAFAICGGHKAQPAQGLLVVNSLGLRRTDVIQAVVGGCQLLDGWDAVAPDGTRSPIQVVHHRTNWSHSWQTIVFVAHDMPALGYRFYRFEPPVTATAPHQYWGTVGHTFSGSKLRVVIDPSCGGLASVQDLETGVQALARDTRALFEVWDQGEYGLDYGMEHKAWWLGLTGERKRIRELAQLPQLLEQGPVRMRCRLQHDWGDSRFTQQFIVYRDLARLDVDVQLDFYEIEKTIRLAFEANVGAQAKSLHSIPCGAIHRPADGREYPMQNWAALYDDDNGIAVLNDGRYGVSTEDSTLRITVVRNATYPDLRSDHGAHRFRYSVVPVSSATIGRAVSEGAAINRPLSGHLMQNAPTLEEGALVDIDMPDGVELACAKVAEDGDGLIIRLFESIGREVTVSMAGDGHVTETDILEGPGAPGDGTINLRPFEIKCLRLRMPTARA